MTFRPFQEAPKIDPSLPPTLTARDRALAEVARARGWVDDASLARAAAETVAGGPSLADALFRSGNLSLEQIRSLSEAVDGVPSTVVPRREPPGGAAPPPEGARIGPYRLLNELGRGGVGVVYRALHEGLRREVALKVLLRGSDASEETEARFRREAEMLAKLGRHPNVVQVYDVGREEGRLWFAMDFVDGPSLSQRAHGLELLSPREAAAIVADAAAGLAAAHAAGIVHRDVKPANILVAKDGRGVVGDFGLARDERGASGLTLSGDVFGTPAYMSPEQAAGAGRHATAASDVFSLGGTLYEALTGKQPFEGLSMADLLKNVIEGEPPAPTSLRAGLHPDLEVICQKAMRKRPSDRYASAKAMESDLRKWLTGQPIEARPQGALERLGAWARRRRAVVAALAVALAVAAGGAGWGARVLLKQAAEAKDAKKRRDEAKDRTDRGRDLVDLAVEDDNHGRLARRDGRLGDAEKLLRRAIELAPGEAEGYFQLGRALALSGRNREALREFRNATDRSPAHALAWFEHGRLALDALSRVRNSGQLRAVRRISEAGLYDRVALPMAIDDGGLGLGAAELADMAEKDFDRVLASNAAPEKADYGRAVLKLLRDDADGAMETILEALRRNAYDADALRAAADIETSRGRPQEAIPWRNKLLEVRPASPAARLEAAIALSTTRLFLARDLHEESAAMRARARKLVDDALSGADRDARLLLFAATVLAGLDESGAALPLAREAVSLARNPAERRDATVAVIALLSVTRADEALLLLDASPDVITGEDRRALRVSLLVRCRREGEAVREWRALAPDTELWRTRLADGGIAELACGNLRAAEACARRIADPPRPWNSTLLAVVLAAQGRTSEAVPLLDSAEPNLGMDVYMSRAEVYWLAGRYLDSCRATIDAVKSASLGASDAKFVQIIERLADPLVADPSTANAALVLSRLEVYNALTLGADPTLRRDLLQGNWAALERMYAVEQEWTFRTGETAKSIEAGKRLLDLHRAGLWLFRDARARAKAGDRDGALKALAEAVEKGFEEEEWLDGEPAFDDIRKDAGFGELRGKIAAGSVK